MPCILCLKTDECLSSKTSIDIFSDEAINWDVQGILMQHLWVEPKKDDICTQICEDCWKCLFEFHEFYIRIQKIHQETKKNKCSTALCESIKPKIEQIDCLLESDLSEHKHVLALEEYPIDETAATDIALTGDTLTCEDMENSKRTRRYKMQNNKQSKCEIKKRRGRPPKAQQEVPLTGEETHKDCSDQVQNQDQSNILVKTLKNNDNKSHSRRDLKQYDNFIAENIKLNCDVCQVDFDNFTNLQVHFRTKHKSRGYILCCGKKLLKRGVLIDHLYTHKDSEYFKCVICDKVLADRRCLEQHQQTHQEKGEPQFKCDICSKAFHLRAVYRRHFQNHTPQENRKFECTECAKRYASKYLLNNHVRLVHLKKYSRICDICGKKIIGSEAFRVHQQQHKGVQQVALNCDICGVSAKTKYYLARHKKVKHTIEYQTPQQCKYCSKISPNMLALNRHISYMHSLKRTHECSMCEKSFKRSKDLKEHFTTHTGDILYFCTFCPKTFNSNANMYAHRKKQHPKEWAQNLKTKSSNALNEVKLH